MGISKSQYKGTLKNSICTKCGKHLNYFTRVEQDQHAENHRLADIETSKQTKLF